MRTFNSTKEAIRLTASFLQYRRDNVTHTPVTDYCNDNDITFASTEFNKIVYIARTLGFRVRKSQNKIYE